MITSIKEYKRILESKDDNTDVFIIDVNEADINEDFLKDLNKFLEKQTRVFNITTNKPNQLTFKNEVKKFNKADNKVLDIDNVQYYFPQSLQAHVYKVLKNIPNDNTVFDTIYGDKFIYLGKQEWLYIEKELVDILKNIKKLKRKICLIGKKQSLKYFYTIIKSFDIEVTFESDFIYSEPMHKKEEEK